MKCSNVFVQSLLLKYSGKEGKKFISIVRTRCAALLCSVLLALPHQHTCTVVRLVIDQSSLVNKCRETSSEIKLFFYFYE